MTYTNPRFGTSIRYPAELFVPQPPPENGDGRTFASANGLAQFLVFGQFNAFEKTLAELIADDKADPRNASVTYERTGRDWYVLSGYRGEKVFYRKVLLRSGGEVLHVFEIDYPASAKPVFDPMAANMAKAFTAPEAEAPAADAGPGEPADPSSAADGDTGADGNGILELFPEETGK